MENQKIGKHSFLFSQPPVITHWASIAGKKEAEGPLAHTFDLVEHDNYFHAKTWEQAENTMQKLVLQRLLEKANKNEEDIDIVFSGDLLNQCIGSSFSLRNKDIAHIGLYGACSTMAESLITAAFCVGGGFAKNAVAMTSSHFAASERQFRFPLGYGGQRTPTAQWTVTGSGAALICCSGKGPVITGCTIGTITDLGITDANNMGAAMAPAALATIMTHLNDFQADINSYDLIVTGDLGQTGKEVLLTLAQKEHLPLAGRLDDCGTMIFDLSTQDVHSGGSGCGCSAITLCGYLLNQVASGKLKKILFCGTGALLSPTSTQQNNPIPGICHGVVIEGKNL